MGNPHAQFFVVSVVLPFVFVLIMNGIEALVESSTWRKRLIKVSWDNCVLAIGISAGVFASGDVLKAHPGGWSVIETSAGIALSLFTAIGIAGIRKTLNSQEPKVSGWKVFLCVALSGAALCFPAYVSLTF